MAKKSTSIAPASTRVLNTPCAAESSIISPKTRAHACIVAAQTLSGCTPGIAGCDWRIIGAKRWLLQSPAIAASGKLDHSELMDSSFCVDDRTAPLLTLRLQMLRAFSAA